MMEKIDRKPSIGIIFPPRKGNGGIFQYAMSVAEGLINYCSDFNYTILHFENSSLAERLRLENKNNVKFISLILKKNNLMDKIGIASGIITGSPIFSIGRQNRDIMKKSEIDLLILTSTSLAGFEKNIPYIVPILDMMYKNYQLYFPEYSSLKTRIISQVVLKYLADHSRLCVADSELEKKDIVKFLFQSEEKVMAIPIIPAKYIFSNKEMSKSESENIIGKYNLPEKFIFYPAQFWRHKNHLRLIESIKILEKDYDEKINLVLAGNPKVNEENYSRIMELIRLLDLEDRIFILGYVSDKEIVALYKKSTALVFPTFAGPTNLPPLEAMILGTPVLYSNLFDMPEQLGEAGAFFDPRNPSDMAKKINLVWTDENLRKKMILAGYEKTKNLTFENYAKMWTDAVKRAF